MGVPFQQFLAAPRVYTCASCSVHVANDDHIISMSFQDQPGSAFLFDRVVNVVRGPAEDRVLLSGVHKVADISCSLCMSVLGWIYLAADTGSQQYKVGKVLLEKSRVSRQDL